MIIHAMKTGTSRVARCRPKRDIRPTVRHIKTIRAAPVTGAWPEMIASGVMSAITTEVRIATSTPPAATAARPAIAAALAQVAANSLVMRIRITEGMRITIMSTIAITTRRANLA